MSESPSAPSPTATSLPLTSRIAARLGTFAPTWAIFGLLLVHICFIPPLGAFYFYVIALFTGLLALAFGIAAVIVTRNDPNGPGRTGGWLGMASGAVMITVTIAGMGDGGGSPPINDITTNLEDPPAFASAADVPDFEGRDMSYPADFVPIVRASYSDLQTVEVARDPADAFAHAVATAEELGWEVVHRDAAAGTINARESSAVFKFVDDVVIRIRPGAGSGSAIDLRSKSRDGRGDLGANAKRIRAFFAAYGA